MKSNLKTKDDKLIEKFKKLVSRQDVADLLEITDKQLRYYLYYLSSTDKYNQFEIPKKRGGFRQIKAPKNRFKLIQKNLAYVLYLVHKSKFCSYGFEKRYECQKKGTVLKGIVPNARLHVNRKNLLNIDIED